MSTKRNPDSIHAPLGPYSHQVEVAGPARQLAIAGQIGMDAGGEIPSEPSRQLEQALRNVLSNLEAADMGPADLTKLTIYLTEEISPDERGPIFASVLGDERPAMTLVYVARLAAPPLKAEVEAWAAQPLRS
jgi:enamine deaminase RidA (YjgF/YER057c/UK114 family)